MNLILTGATGMVGAEVLRQALTNPRITRLTVLTRRPLGLTHPKLHEVIHTDFLDYSALAPLLRGHDACLWCLGTSQTQVGKAAYDVITHDYTLAGAQAMLAANPELTFGFLSAEGADSSERSPIRFARVKGRTENDLRMLPFEKLYLFRPAYVHPVQPRPQPWLIERAFNHLLPLLYAPLRRGMITSEALAEAMLTVMLHGHAQRILHNPDLRSLAETGHALPFAQSLAAARGALPLAA